MDQDRIVEIEDEYPKEKMVTLLSIDGGGVKGIIPAVFLKKLESQLQKINGDQARIADYFDVIAGTSAGGLITTMLTAPNKYNRPMFSAEEILKFLKDHSPKIFDWSEYRGLKWIRNFFGPKFSGRYLRKLIQKELGHIKISQTLTNVVIPAFDIKRLQPIIFSTIDAKSKCFKDASLADVCISTSAAPTYFPAHHFKIKNEDGHPIRYHLIDGGVAANNPTLTGITHISRVENNKEFSVKNIGPIDGKNILVLSLGTGVRERRQKNYDAREAAGWGLLHWLCLLDGRKPLLDVFEDAPSDMVDIHVSTFFQSQHCRHHYLRIQEDKLTGNATEIDFASKENMENLEKIATERLEKKATRVNIETGEYDTFDGAKTNKEELKHFALLLSEIKKAKQ